MGEELPDICIMMYDFCYLPNFKGHSEWTSQNDRIRKDTKALLRANHNIIQYISKTHQQSLKKIKNL